MFRSGNPTLKPSTFTGLERTRGEGAMTLDGTVNKTGISLLILLAFAAIVWNGVFGTVMLLPLMLVGLVGGLVLSLTTIFKKEWAPVTTPIYAAMEGLLLGAISLVFEARYPGVVLNAVGLTFGTLAAMLLAYRAGLVRATENFKLGVLAATGGIALVYLVSIVLRMFGKSIPFIHGSGAISIGFSVFVVVIAALNLVLDFDMIERGAQAEAPKYMEWYGAFALLVTLVWLYLEILRLMSKLQGRRR
jgi:uncharacterized YccA/Bax inhibitor family protein